MLTLFLNSLKGWNLLIPRAFHPYLFVQLLHRKLPSPCCNGFVFGAQTLVQIEKGFFPQSLHLVCKRLLGVWELCGSIQLQNSPLCKMLGMALMWQLAMLAQVVFDRRQRKREGRKEKKCKHKRQSIGIFLLRWIAFAGISSFSPSFSCKKHLYFSLYRCFVMAVKNSLFDWICHWRHLVILMDSLDAGPRLAGSIFFKMIFFSYDIMETGLPFTADWTVSGIIWHIVLYMPVYKNVNDNHS